MSISGVEDIILWASSNVSDRDTGAVGVLVDESVTARNGIM